MKSRFIAALVLILLSGRIASAHRLDEYLQATMLSIEKDSVVASMRLVPGVAVSADIISGIDSNHDGIFSSVEQRSYAQQVLGDLLIAVDRKPLKPKLISVSFPTAGQMREGLGEIHIEYSVDLPSGGDHRSLILENVHQRQRSAYLVNALVPSDRNIQITTQRRNEQQSVYEVDYLQTGVAATSRPAQWWMEIHGAFIASGFPSLFRLGMRHIAEGTDHLLFLLALLLPAPLLASGSRWTGPAGLHRSVLRILRIVTAFTIGHSITLGIAAWGLVSVPARPIEILIAISILVSAIHAIRPIFPGKEAGIAAFFGLIHGLAFAATLGNLGLGRWERVFGILAFNLGIESMQLLVVAVTMPSLLMLSRRPEYRFLRTGGALFAGVASIGWVVERSLGIGSSVDVVVMFFAHHAILIAIALFLISLGGLLQRPVADPETTTRMTHRIRRIKILKDRGCREPSHS